MTLLFSKRGCKKIDISGNTVIQSKQTTFILITKIFFFKFGDLPRYITIRSIGWNRRRKSSATNEFWRDINCYFKTQCMSETILELYAKVLALSRQQ